MDPSLAIRRLDCKSLLKPGSLEVACTAVFYSLPLSSANSFYLDHRCKSEQNEDTKAVKNCELELKYFKAFYPNPFMQLDALTTVMKVKALLYIMSGMNTCGTEIYHPYKQSVTGHYYSNQNICVCVNIRV